MLAGTVVLLASLLDRIPIDVPALGGSVGRHRRVHRHRCRSLLRSYDRVWTKEAKREMRPAAHEWRKVCRAPDGVS
jgi:hypothetical protein